MYVNPDPAKHDLEQKVKMMCLEMWNDAQKKKIRGEIDDKNWKNVLLNLETGVSNVVNDLDPAGFGIYSSHPRGLIHFVRNIIAHYKEASHRTFMAHFHHDIFIFLFSLEQVFPIMCMGYHALKNHRSRLKPFSETKALYDMCYIN